MAYSVKVDRRCKRKYKIVNNETGKVVGSSLLKRKAKASIAHREKAESSRVKSR